jgi:hypothetical protein
VVVAGPAPGSLAPVSALAGPALDGSAFAPDDGIGEGPSGLNRHMDR